MGNFFRCVRARANLHALMTQKSCAVGMRNAILRNHLNFVCFLFQSLRLRILLVCLHIIVIIIIIPYSEWTAVAARGQPPVRTQPWAAVLVHATRLVRNLSSAGTRARQELRDEKDLVDCLVWITRVGVKNENYDNRVS